MLRLGHHLTGPRKLSFKLRAFLGQQTRCRQCPSTIKQALVRHNSCIPSKTPDTSFPCLPCLGDRKSVSTTDSYRKCCLCVKGPCRLKPRVFEAWNFSSQRGSKSGGPDSGSSVRASRRGCRPSPFWRGCGSQPEPAPPAQSAWQGTFQQWPHPSARPPHAHRADEEDDRCHPGARRPRW